MRPGTLYAMAAALVILLPAFSSAGDIKRLVMPGDVIKGHAKYENECEKCHKAFSKSTQRTLCLDCHDKVSSDIRRRAGYHGLGARALKEECSNCHPEHKGRDAVVVSIDTDLFDHTLTDYPLKGGHANARCERCHKKGVKWREAKTKCLDCHKERDVHKGNLGEKCSDCHTEKSWTPRDSQGIDHAKEGFPLKGKHRDTACSLCHPNEFYKNTPKDCYSCHRLNDVHAGDYGKKCMDCHSEKDWKESSYDHGKTKFALKDAHRKAACSACHKAAYFDEGKKLKTDCYSCHKNDDVHKGRYGKKCADCHTEKGFGEDTSFDHGKTDFALKEKHKKVACSACHKGPAYDVKTPTECHSCHKQVDVHRGEQGKRCESCHSEKGWGEKVSFEHDLTRFPLIGQHAVATCEDCHPTQAYSKTPSGCVDCHREDDTHKKALGEECFQCHNPNGWRHWRYDHDKETEFRLDGAHKGLNCASCHKRSVLKKVVAPKRCEGCHGVDDPHAGDFGPLCERCHSTKSFKELKIGATAP